MVLAHREEINVTDDDHLIVLLFEDRTIKDLLNIHRVPTRKILHRCGGTMRRTEQADTLWILADLGQDASVEITKRRIGISFIFGSAMRAGSVLNILTGQSRQFIEIFCA